MGTDAAIDTQYADYTGERVTSLATAVYLRLMTPLGSWWADASLGSRLHELLREKDVARVRILAAQYAEQALAPLVTDGRALAVSVTASQPYSGRCDLDVSITDATGQQQLYSHSVRVA